MDGTPAGGQGGNVPAGAILAALDILEITSQGENPTAAAVRQASDLIGAWGAPVLAKAYSLLIYGAIASVHPAEGAPDNLHMTVPAVLTRLRKIEKARPYLPTMAGVVTAAATGADPWQWRMSLGPVPSDDLSELQAWCWTAWLLADLLDTGHGEPGRFIRDSRRTVFLTSD